LIHRMGGGEDGPGDGGVLVVGDVLEVSVVSVLVHESALHAIVISPRDLCRSGRREDERGREGGRERT
jgi:hypothetical protein